MNNKIPNAVIKVICEAWQEMNRIRARDGVPYDRNGFKSDISQEYWDDIMNRLDRAVRRSTGTGAWENPILFKETPPNEKGSVMSAPKYCDDPDYCTYSDCPTAFCDRGMKTNETKTEVKNENDRCLFCYDREQGKNGEVKREWASEWNQFFPLCRKHTRNGAVGLS